MLVDDLNLFSVLLLSALSNFLNCIHYVDMNSLARPKHMWINGDIRQAISLLSCGLNSSFILDFRIL